MGFPFWRMEQRGTGVDDKTVVEKLILQTRRDDGDLNWDGGSGDREK